MRLGKTLHELGPEAREADPHLGEILDGRYRLLRHHGSGQMARVYVAEQMSMERNVAVKVLRDEVARDEIAVKRFRQEIQIAARLRSPHTVACYDAGVSWHGANFIAMELLAGETLRGRLAREDRLAPGDVVAITAQIGESLREAHEAGIIHRDLKPDNVYVCAHPTPMRPFVKVLDFGLAKLVEATEAAPKLTAHQTTVGTPAYMAPEQVIRDRTVDHRCDIYALGVMCFEMLTGQRPFRARGVMQMVLAHATHPVPSATAIEPSLPAAVDDFFRCVMAKPAAARPDHATEVAELLERALRS